MITNMQLARYATQIARRASAWAHDTMTMGDHYWNEPAINNSPERFCKDIEDVLEWIKAQHAASPSA